MSTVYLNGEFVDPEDPCIPAADRAVLFGIGLFETMRAYSGVPFRLRRHLERLYDSARALDLPPPIPREEAEKAIGEVIRRSGLDDARVRVTFTGGGAEPGPAAAPSAIVMAIPIDHLPPQIYEEGIHVLITPLDRAMALAPHKTTSAMAKMIALRDAERAGAFEAIFRNPAGRICEGATSNCFVLRHGEIRTPPLSEGILPGITREITVGLAAGIGFPVSERGIDVEDLLEAEEAFITASVKEIVPVIKVGEKTIGNGRPGPVTKRLLSAYRDLVRKECTPTG